MLDIFQTDGLSETRQSEFATGLKQQPLKTLSFPGPASGPMGLVPLQDYRHRKLQTAIGEKHGRKD